MDLINIIKLSRILSKLEKVDSDQGPITAEAIEVGKEVFIDGAEGDVIPAPDGAYIIEGGKRKITVLDGKISNIEEITVNPDTVPVNNEEEPKKDEPEEKKCEEEPKEEVKTEENPNTDEKDAKIAELEAKIAELEAKIAEKEAEIESIKNAPVKTEMKKVENKSPFKTYKH